MVLLDGTLHLSHPAPGVPSTLHHVLLKYASQPNSSLCERRALSVMRHRSDRHSGLLWLQFSVSRYGVFVRERTVVNIAQTKTLVSDCALRSDSSMHACTHALESCVSTEVNHLLIKANVLPSFIAKHEQTALSRSSWRVHAIIVSSMFTSLTIFVCQCGHVCVLVSRIEGGGCR